MTDKDRPIGCRLVLAIALLLPGAVRAAEELPTKERPLVVDEVGKRVRIYTEVNLMRLYFPNVHWAVVFKDAKMSDRGVLKAWVDQVAFHNALVKIGAKPGDNLKEGENGKVVEGEPLQVTVTWPGLGKELPLSSVISDSAGKGYDIRFGGNLRAAIEKKTGCLLCLESCWASIVSNARYPMNTALPALYLRPNSLFQGKADVLPGQEAAAVVVTFARVSEQKR